MNIKLNEKKNLIVCSSNRQDGLFFKKILETNDYVKYMGFCSFRDIEGHACEIGAADIIFLEIKDFMTEYEKFKQILQINPYVYVVAYCENAYPYVIFQELYKEGLFAHIEKPMAVTDVNQILGSIVKEMSLSLELDNADIDISSAAIFANKISGGKLLNPQELAEEIFDELQEKARQNEQQLSFYIKKYLKEINRLLEKNGIDTEDHVLKMIFDKHFRQVNEEIDQTEALEIIVEYVTDCNNLIYLSKKTLHEDRIQYAKKLMYEHMETEKPITLESIAKEMFISPFYLSRTFKKIEGINFMDYLKQVRIEHGKIMLSTTSESIQEIAFKCGYSEGNSFRRSFKKMVGISPSDYRKQKTLQHDVNK